jgi:hypothetical protein
MRDDVILLFAGMLLGIFLTVAYSAHSSERPDYWKLKLTYIDGVCFTESERLGYLDVTDKRFCGKKETINLD